MKVEQYLSKFAPEQVCTVNGNPVWDYKIVERDEVLELRLISEAVAGSEKYEHVTCSELADYVGIWTMIRTIDETTGNEVNSV